MSNPASDSNNGVEDPARSVTDLVQTIPASVLSVVRLSNSIPSAGDDFDFYSSYESFRSLMDLESSRCLETIQRLMKYCGLRGNVTSKEVRDSEDLFDVVVEANDQILERAGMYLDEAAGLKKDLTPLVMTSLTPRQQHRQEPAWNKATAAARKTTFHLLTKKNIERSQMKFQDKIDNSDRIWSPRLQEKPNAKLGLQESLRVEIGSVNESDPSRLLPHPYQHELDTFEPVPSQLQHQDLGPCPPVAETPLHFISSDAELSDVVAQLCLEPVIAVDLENHSYRSYQGFTCLVQISTISCDYIIDALALRHSLNALNHVFTHPNIVKVFHGSDSDVEWLQRDFSVYVVNMFDTHQAARALSFSRLSLAAILEHYCGVQLDKRFQLADWRIRPLPDELVAYAREDTHYLPFVYELMKRDLLDRSNGSAALIRSVLDKSRWICSKTYSKPVCHDDAHLSIYRKGRKVFNLQQLQALKELYKWRDTVARQEDESTGFVLPNHMLMQIAENLPREPQGVIACCNPVPPLVKQYLNEIHQRVKTAREQPTSGGQQASAGTAGHEHERVREQEVPEPQTEHLQGYSKVDDTSPFAELYHQHDKSHSRVTHGERHKVCSCHVSTKLRPSIMFQAVSSQSSSSWRSDDVQDQVHQIKSLFVSPFDKFLPLDQASRDPTQEKISISSKQNVSKWQLKQGPETTSTQHTFKTPNITQHAFRTPIVIQHTSGPMKQSPASEIKREPERDEVGLSKEQPRKRTRNKISNVGVRDKASDEPSTSDNTSFQPFDYSQADYNILFPGDKTSTEPPTKKRDGSESAQARVKPGRKAKVWQPASAKSVTYSGKQTSQPRYQRPK